VFFICGIIEVDRCFDSKKEFVLKIKLNSLPKDVFFGRFRPQTKTKTVFVWSACVKVGHLMVLNLTVLKQPDSRVQSRLMFTNNLHNAVHLDCSSPEGIGLLL